MKQDNLGNADGVIDVIRLVNVHHNECIHVLDVWVASLVRN